MPQSPGTGTPAPKPGQRGVCVPGSRPTVKRTRLRFSPDPRRVIARLFTPGGPDRVEKIVRRVCALSDAQVRRMLNETLERFAHRHHGIEQIFLEHFARGSRYARRVDGLSRERKLLLGSYFTKEYSIESAALFNPSVVAAPDQAGLPPGHCRLILSFRATGEGHISCLEFRGAVINPRDELSLDPVSLVLETPRLAREMFYEKDLFAWQLLERGVPRDASADLSAFFRSNEVLAELLRRLPPSFTYEQLERAMEAVSGSGAFDPETVAAALSGVRWLARSNYTVRFAPRTNLSERILFPTSEAERRGIEDARFVEFVEDGERTYYATYAGFDGARVRTQLLETRDFLTFRISTLSGRHANSKGMALFPRKLAGKYAMVSRIDGENLYVMYSDDIRFWHRAQRIQEPREPWEYVQIGNCGPPIETEAGWLLLTHGVGPMRRYCIGATLLDRDDPTRLLGCTREPILAPREDEREGYVPNVVYSCGALVRHNRLILPYAMSDTASGIACVSLPELLQALQGGC